MEYFKVKMLVSYYVDYETYAHDEDDAFNMAQKEVLSEVPNDAYQVDADADEITVEIDEGYDDVDR